MRLMISELLIREALDFDRSISADLLSELVIAGERHFLDLLPSAFLF